MTVLLWRPMMPVALLALAVSGCGLPAFTEAVRDRFGLGAADVRRVQFFTSGEIVLRREVTAQGKGVARHELELVSAVRIEEVIIARRTPCVAVRVEPNFILCGFARQRPDRSLWFAIKKLDDTIATDERRYELVHLENTADEPRPMVPRYSKGFLVNYAGHQYQVADGFAWNVHLLYELKESFEKERVRERPDGWKLDEGPPPADRTVSSSPR